MSIAEHQKILAILRIVDNLITHPKTPNRVKTLDQALANIPPLAEPLLKARQLPHDEQIRHQLMADEIVVGILYRSYP